MKRSITLVMALCLSVFTYAQELTLAETKELLNSSVWMLRRIEVGEKMYSLPDYLVGKRMVFVPKKSLMYTYFPKENGAIQLMEYKITADEIITGSNLDDPRYKYEIKNIVGYQIYMQDIDEEDGMTYVWEINAPLEGDGYLKERKYDKPVSKKPFFSHSDKMKSLTKELNENLQQAAGNLRIYKNKSKILVSEANCELSERGITFTSKLQQSGKSTTTQLYSFLPSMIDSIQEYGLDANSPGGLIRIKLKAPFSFFSSQTNKRDYEAYYREEVYLSFLKIKPGAYQQMRKLLLDLKNEFNQQAPRLEKLVSMMDIRDKFWVSREGSSNNYTLLSASVAGTKLLLEYHHHHISTSAETKKINIVEVPMEAVTDLIGDKAKSSPYTLLLKADRDGFTTYSYNPKTENYTSTYSTKEVPLFIDVTKADRLERVGELIKAYIRETAGRKVNWR